MPFERLDDHERRLIALEQSDLRMEAKLTDIQTRMAEMHSENRSVSDEREKRTREDSRETRAAVERIARRIDTIVSWRSVIGWAVVTASSAGVATAIAHMPAFHP